MSLCTRLFSFLSSHIRPPVLKWKSLPLSPVERYDAGSIQVGARLYCIGGYKNLGEIISAMDVFDLAEHRWVERIQLPPKVAQSHCALACETERFFYFAGGQVGPHCAPCVADVRAFDLHTRRGSTLPPLPEPRYAGTMQPWNGRLHFLGGARQDRYTPAADH